MAFDYHLHDGYRDQQSLESISYHESPEPWAVKITPKDVGSEFAIPQSFVNYLDSVDYGTPDGLHRGNPPASGTSGETVILYFKPVVFIDEFYGSDWSDILSQIKVLHNAFPPGLGIMAPDTEVLIDSVDFEAPEGIFNCNGYRSPIFPGSTFKVAPRVYGDEALRSTLRWPPQAEDWMSSRWDPFLDCPNVETIEYQGDLGNNCQSIYGSNLVYKDSDGYERVDAYPGGGKPQVIIDAIGPLERFEMDSGSRFPDWDVENLEFCIRPVMAEAVVLPTRSAAISIPIGPDVRNESAPKLKHYTNGILSVVRGIDPDTGDDQDCPLVFGLKLLGIDLSDSTVRCVNAHMLYRHQMSFGDSRQIGVRATPTIVKTMFNFSLGSALETFYGNPDEVLLMPRAPLAAEYINRWGEVDVEEIYASTGRSKPYYWVTIYPNNTMGGLEFPRIESPNLKWLDGYMENTLSYGRTGYVDFEVTSGLSYDGTVKHKVPAPPNHAGLSIRNYRRYMAAYTSGSGPTYPTITPAQTAQLVYGPVSEFSDSITPVAVLNVDGSWFEGDSPEAVYFRELINEESYQALNDVVSGRIQREATYSVNISYDGFELETFDTSDLEYVFNWEEGVFWQAQIDPRTIDNILTPIRQDQLRGVDGAYRGALNVATPLSASVRYIDQRDTNEPSQEMGGGTFTPNYTLILGFGVPDDLGDMYTYEIDRIDIPDFQLTDQEGSVYGAWEGVFSGLIWGDIDGFKEAHGIDPSIDTGGRTTQPDVASGDSIGLGVLNWRVIQFGPLGYQVAIPISLNPDGLGQRGFGTRLFREEIPYYPDDAPLYGDPIFINFGGVGANYTWSDGDIYSFREAVKPQTEPIDN